MMEKLAGISLPLVDMMRLLFSPADNVGYLGRFSFRLARLVRGVMSPAPPWRLASSLGEAKASTLSAAFDTAV
jgi:hypothetical protein